MWPRGFFRYPYCIDAQAFYHNLLGVQRLTLTQPVIVLLCVCTVLLLVPGESFQVLTRVYCSDSERGDDWVSQQKTSQSLRHPPLDLMPCVCQF